MTTGDRRFNGFVIDAAPAVEIPRAFFTDVLPALSDLAELQVTLTAFRLVSEAGGIDRPLAQEAIRRDRALRSALRVQGSPREPDLRIATGLDLAVARGTLLRFVADHQDGGLVWYYVNTPANQALVSAMARGAVAPPETLWRNGDVPGIRPERPNVFRLYEQNVGLLTPLIADQLIAALESYPQEWIEDAIAEAVGYNRRSWRYIQRILQQWATDGRRPEPNGAAAAQALPRRTRR